MFSVLPTCIITTCNLPNKTIFEGFFFFFFIITFCQLSGELRGWVPWKIRTQANIFSDTSKPFGLFGENVGLFCILLIMLKRLSTTAVSSVEMKYSGTTIMYIINSRGYVAGATTTARINGLQAINRCTNSRPVCVVIRGVQ